MTSPEPLACRLLQLPKELRMVMYEAAFIKSEDAIPLLQSCRQIHEEALPTLYHSPAAFSSQASFLAWIDRSTDVNLGHITTLRLSLTDIDLSALFDRRLTESTTARPTPTSLLHAELQKLLDAFKRLPNLTTLTVIPPEHAQPAFPRVLYQPLLAALPTQCPLLRTLELHESAELLDDIPSLRLVGDVRFTKGLSRRPSPEETDERTKRSPRPATVDFAAMLELIHPGRRAMSEPALPSSARVAARRLRGVERSMKAFKREST